MLTTLLSYWRTMLFNRNAPTLRQGYRLTGAALRDPTEFYQSNALEAAVMKRRRRADRLQQSTARSAKNNDAHFTDGVMPACLNPFYVAK